jgi:hypothetical protein
MKPYVDRHTPQLSVSAQSELLMTSVQASPLALPDEFAR